LIAPPHTKSTPLTSLFVFVTMKLTFRF